ncbi:hypothetical protein [Streptomyces palmae]|uniref:Uncharacterized protein n=1 Tax=Streptomyces palmae TaxID=1701085 RepID=A0A4Z0FKF5_9ACTN|nr:hypothetical protein [Streptomyces palmae]TGA83163.1 hypothetical protein E4099_32485 [Streptomyces palmae]
MANTVNRPVAPAPSRKPAVLAATLLGAVLAVLLSGCGQQSADADPARTDDRSTGASQPADATSGQGSRIDTGTVYFHSGAAPTPEVRQVIENREQLDAFARRFGSARGQEITARAERADFSRQVLVGWSVTTGCATWPSATLHRSGDTLGVVPGAHHAPPRECLAAQHALAVFAVPREKMPEHPRLTH